MSFIRWAGGKTKLLKDIIPKIYSFYNENKKNIYIEPFLGGGSVLIELLKYDFKFDKYICTDLNRNLIITFNQIKNNHLNLIKSVLVIQHEFDDLNDEQKEEYYYTKRKEYNDIIESNNKDLQIATLFIFLNKTSFRGLYRVTKEGNYNIPYGHNKNPKLLNPLYTCSLHNLFNKHNVEFIHQSYESTLDYINEFEDCNCIVYLDPPYYGTFDNYTKEGFDYIRFINFLIGCNKLYCHVILSNSQKFKEKLEDLDLYDNIEEIIIQDRINSKHPDKTRIEILAY